MLETIECVAIKAPDGVVASQGKPARHHDVIRHMCDVMGYDRVTGAFTQGFITSENRFVDRKEAVDIAVAAGQTEHHEWGPRLLLFSEDLW